MKVAAEILQVALMSVLSLVVLFVVTRLGGKRQIAQMSMFDYVNSITIGSIAAEMATNLEEWYKPMAGIIVYGVIAWLVHYAACKGIKARLLVSGQSIVLMENGVIYKHELKRASIDINEFLAQSRIAGYFDLNQVQSAVLETNGHISFLPKAQYSPVTTGDMNLKHPEVSLWTDLILDGEIMRENLSRIGRDETWLVKQLAQGGFGSPGEVFYAACDNGSGFFACPSK